MFKLLFSTNESNNLQSKKFCTVYLSHTRILHSLLYDLNTSKTTMIIQIDYAKRFSVDPFKQHKLAFAFS